MNYSAACGEVVHFLTIKPVFTTPKKTKGKTYASPFRYVTMLVVVT